MANGYIDIAYLYKRMPVLTDTNGDHLIAVSDLRTAIALAAAETGEVHPMPPCKKREGEWYKASDKMPIYRCSVCNERNLFKEGNNVLSNYCPNCGSKMKGGE